jgi:hypothetical protein
MWGIYSYIPETNHVSRVLVFIICATCNDTVHYYYYYCLCLKDLHISV